MAEYLEKLKDWIGNSEKLKDWIGNSETIEDRPSAHPVHGYAALMDEEGIPQEGDPIGRRGLSKYTYNASAYYDDKKVNLRLAYNWRSEFTRREIVQLGFARPEALPEIEAARGQLDFAARVNKSLAVDVRRIRSDKKQDGHVTGRPYQLTCRRNRGTRVENNSRCQAGARRAGGQLWIVAADRPATDDHGVHATA